MAGPSTKPYNVADLKSKLMRPALTSHYICKFQPTDDIIRWVNVRSRERIGLTGENYNNRPIGELIEISCSEASLPGSSLNTNDINDDFTGVTQKFAYRRLYDSTADFTFYVDRDYTIISFFEGWLSYITKEEYERGLILNDNYFYRVRFPDKYRTNNLYVTKFEKDTGTRTAGKYSLEYKFIGAYPTSITSMPVSYDQSQLLKCTVSFTYDRYFVRKVSSPLPPPPPPPAPGNPEIPPPPAPPAPARLPEGAVFNDFLNGNRQTPDGRGIGNPALDQFGVRDPLGRGAPGTTGANILA